MRNKWAETIVDVFIFSNESQICIGQDCLKKTCTFPQSLTIWGCMSGKGTGEMAVITSSINAQVYVDMLDTFLIPSIERMFGDDDIVYQDDNASCHRAKTVKTFLEERRIEKVGAGLMKSTVCHSLSPWLRDSMLL
uniref:Tc1-like transposase DDE domain-containing protein n=1 Tax=Gouania willdenowi TaxID=441366 RepID=A0A8C5I7Z6_GOUWI